MERYIEHLFKFPKRWQGVGDNDKNLVEQHSTECSDIYGDVIHLARAIATHIIKFITTFMMDVY